MIVVRLAGGLGNQLFQYAVGRHLALRRGTSLHLDLSGLQQVAAEATPRPFALGPYELPARLDGHRYLPWALSGDGLPRRAIGRLTRSRRAVLTDDAGAFDPSVLDAPDGSILIGYWQSERYFADIADVIRSDVQLGEASAVDATTAEALSREDAVSVHVRRGDYVTSPVARDAHGSVSMDYYRRAVQRARQHVQHPHLFVFSDDPAWCRSHLDLGCQMTVVSDEDRFAPHVDLHMMAMCKHHITANSSFSWWGAWLGSARGGVVVAPARWSLRPGYVPHIHPDGWILEPN